MNNSMTAEELLVELKTMPFTERGRFFSILGEPYFQNDDFSHQQVFGHLNSVYGRSQMFATRDLKQFKRVLSVTVN